MPALQPPALLPAEVPHTVNTNYPNRFREVVAGRSKQRLGDALRLTNFGVNLTTLKPGAASSLRHWHTVQDEFIYVISGQLTLVTDSGEQILSPGMAAGFAAGQSDGHHLLNRTGSDAVYLEVGDRLPGDAVHYADADLEARTVAGKWTYFHKDGTAY